MRRLLITCIVAAATALVPRDGEPLRVAAAADAPAPIAGELPAGSYRLDKAHSSLIFRISHLGFSLYTGRFTSFEVALQLDPGEPAAARLAAEIDPRSLAADNPPEGFIDQLLGPVWLDAAAYPEISFHSTAVQPTGPDTALVTGDLTLHGVTRPVILEVRFNGGYAGHPLDPNARIGFSARGSLERSRFGISEGLPPPGTAFGVGDRVEIAIEAELTGPPLAVQ